MVSREHMLRPVAVTAAAAPRVVSFPQLKTEYRVYEENSYIIILIGVLRFEARIFTQHYFHKEIFLLKVGF